MPTDIGPPDYKTMLPPMIQRNYGKWRYHEILQPGVMVHVGETGEALYTVRAGIAAAASTDHIREICDIADKYCGGYLRFTSRNNIEFLLEDKAEGGSAACRAGPEEIPRGRDRARHIQYRPHPGVGALPYAGNGCLRPRQGTDGRDPRVLRDDEAAQPCAHRPGLLPQHVRRRALLRHRHPGHPPDGPEAGQYPRSEPL